MHLSCLSSNPYNYWILNGKVLLCDNYRNLIPNIVFDGTAPNPPPPQSSEAQTGCHTYIPVSPLSHYYLPKCSIICLCFLC